MQKRHKIINGVILLAVFLIASAAVLNMDVSIRQGVNWKYREIHMPLYVKWTQFLARHYEYIRLTKEITSGAKSDEAKTLVLFKWTHDNIRPVPEGFPVVDDHVLNIIIRGYGSSDQSQDVFTTLCFYSGVPAFWSKLYDKSRKVWYPVSFVKLSQRWRVFDAYQGKYFKNRKGEIASVEDIIGDRSILGGRDMDDLYYSGVRYREFYDDLHPVNANKTLRPAKQMPFERAVFELKKLIGVEKEG